MPKRKIRWLSSLLNPINDFMFKNKDLDEDNIKKGVDDFLNMVEFLNKINSDEYFRRNDQLSIAILDSLWVGIYKNYDFGAGDDTGIYWNSEVQYPKETMLYFTTAMEKALFGKYSYGKKLRSPQRFNFKMQLPTKNNEIDFTYMELLISAVKN